jgi:hypothetical protein
LVLPASTKELHCPRSGSDVDSDRFKGVSFSPPNYFLFTFVLDFLVVGDILPFIPLKINNFENGCMANISWLEGRKRGRGFSSGSSAGM